LPMLKVCAEEPPLTPTLALIRTPWWDQLDEDVREGFGELVAHLGDQVGEFILPESSAQALDWHKTIMEADIAASYETDYERGKDKMSDMLREQIERGRAITVVDYRRAEARIEPITESLDEVFDRFDAIITPSAHG